MSPVVDPFAPGSKSGGASKPKQSSGSKVVDPFANGKAPTAPADGGPGAGIKKHKPSLWQQATGLVEGLPSAGANIVKGQWHTVPQRLKLLERFGLLQTQPGAAGADPRKHADFVLGRQKKEGYVKALSRSDPATGAQVASLGNTGGRVLHPSRYLKAAREGNIIPVIAEDVANASLVAAPLVGGLEGAAGRAAIKAEAVGNAARTAEEIATAAKLATRAERLNKVATAASSAEKIAAKTGNLPVYPYQLAAKGIAKATTPLLGPGIERLAASRVGQSVAQGIADHRLRTGTRNFLEERSTLPSDAAAASKAKASRAIEAVVPDPLEQQAVSLIAQGEAHATQGLASLPDAVRHAVADKVFSAKDPRYAASPEALDLAHGYLAGTLPTEQAGRLQTALDLGHSTLRAPRATQELAGIGRTDAGMSPEQVGTTPLADVVAKRSEKAAKLVARQEKVALKAENRAQSLRAGADAKAGVIPLSPVKASISGAKIGAADRQAVLAERVAKLEGKRLVAKQDRLAQTTAAVERSIEAAPARYRPALIHARDAVKELHRQATELDRTTPGTGDALRQVASDIPTTLDALVKAGIDPEHLIGGRIDQKGPRVSAPGEPKLPQVRKLGSQKVRQTGTVPRTVQGQAVMEARRARQVVANETAKTFASTYGKTSSGLGLGQMRGKALADAAREQGFVSWNPSSILERVPDDQVGPKTTFIRDVQFDAFKHWYEPPQAGRVVRGIERTNRIVSHGLLALSPRWHIGNVVSDAVLTMAVGGVSPDQLVALARPALKAMKEGTLPPELLGKGFAADQLRYLRDASGEGPKTPIGRFIQGSYRLNSVGDDLARSITYLSKKGKGLSDAAAVAEALKVGATAAKLTPLEQHYVRLVMPYWQWYKAVTVAAARLPLEHPVRTAWMLKVSHDFGDDQSGLPDFMRGAISVGDNRFVQVGTLNPFGDVSQLPTLSLKGLLRSTSPAIKLGAQAGGGLNVNELRQLTRPKGTANLDSLGRPTYTPLLQRKKELLHNVVGTFPQGRLVQGFTDKRVLRYENGDPIVTGRGQTFPTGRTTTNLLGRFVGVPTPEKIPVGEIMTRAAKRRAQNEKAKAKSKALLKYVKKH